MTTKSSKARPTGKQTVSDEQKWPVKGPIHEPGLTSPVKGSASTEVGAYRREICSYQETSENTSTLRP